jgi:hypothetical protein
MQKNKELIIQAKQTMDNMFLNFSKAIGFYGLELNTLRYNKHSIFVTG